MTSTTRPNADRSFSTMIRFKEKLKPRGPELGFRESCCVLPSPRSTSLGYSVTSPLRKLTWRRTTPLDPTTNQPPPTKIGSPFDRLSRSRSKFPRRRSTPTPIQTLNDVSIFLVLHFLSCCWAGADFTYGTLHAASAVFGRATFFLFSIYWSGGGTPTRKLTTQARMSVIRGPDFDDGEAVVKPS